MSKRKNRNIRGIRTPLPGQNVTDQEIWDGLAETKKHLSAKDAAILEEAIKLIKTGKTLEDKQKGFDKLVNFSSYMLLGAKAGGMHDKEFLEGTANIMETKTAADEFIELRREFDKEDVRTGTIIGVGNADERGIPIIVEFGEWHIVTSMTKNNFQSSGIVIRSGLTVEIKGKTTAFTTVMNEDGEHELPYMISSSIKVVM